MWHPLISTLQPPPNYTTLSPSSVRYPHTTTLCPMCVYVSVFCFWPHCVPVDSHANKAYWTEFKWTELNWQRGGLGVRINLTEMTLSMYQKTLRVIWFQEIANVKLCCSFNIYTHVQINTHTHTCKYTHTHKQLLAMAEGGLQSYSQQLSFFVVSVLIRRADINELHFGPWQRVLLSKVEVFHLQGFILLQSSHGGSQPCHSPWTNSYW